MTAFMRWTPTALLEAIPVRCGKSALLILPTASPPVSSGDANCTAIGPEIGITATPVIDPAGDTIYLRRRRKEHGQFVQRLHALDITTGAEKFGEPVTIQATYPGTGDGSSGGMLSFDPLHHLNRSGFC